MYKIIINTLKKKFTAYNTYKLEDFLADETFIDWVKGGTGNNKWERILKENPNLKDISHKASEIIKCIDFSHHNIPVQRIATLRSRINKRIDGLPLEFNEKKVLSLPISESIAKQHRKKNIAMVAAIFLGVIVLSSLMFFKSSLDKMFFSEDKMITRVAGKGEKLIVYLSDGTKVVMNGGTVISFKENFKDTIRMVKLEGEAFFDVTKDPSKPFIVDADGTLTRALGTSFNINQNKNKVVVSLTTGKVSVVKNNDGNEFKEMLIPGEQIVADFNNDAVFIKQKFNKNEVIGWMNGDLDFNESSGMEVIEKLQNWYGVTIEVNIDEEELKNWSYSGNFQNESLKNVLESISFVKGFQFEIKEDYVNIYK